LGYRIENENALVNYPTYFSETNGTRLDQNAYLQQQFTLGRLSVIAGGRFVHSSTFGNTGVPRVALTLLRCEAGFLFWNPLAFFLCHGVHGTGFPGDLRQSWIGLRPEPRSFAGAHAGVRSRIPAELAGRPLGSKCTYFNNLFHDQIEYGTNTVEYMGNPPGTLYQFFNLQQSLAHGAEVHCKEESGKDCR